MKTINETDYDYKVSAAGRVNIIGEHIDYCGGKVLPAALGQKNTVYVKKTGGDKIVIKWTTLEGSVTLDVNCLSGYKQLSYGNYQAGSLWAWQDEGHKIEGCEMLHDCSVPFGSGLSSSAAIEVSTIAAMCAITGESIDCVKIALAAQRAEREYCGVNCGIMDQYASACGKAGQAMLLDCSTLACEYVPIDIGDYSLVILDCKKPHSLVSGKYNERRAETEKALELLQTRLNVKCLAEVTPNDLHANADVLSPVLLKRATHVVEECARVETAVTAMRNGDMKMLGELLNQSHQSLRDNYEVTGAELDALSDAARAQPCCLGSRMTGGGFGGSTVSLVKTDCIENFKTRVFELYKQTTGYNAECYITDIGDGISVTQIKK